MVRDDNNFDEMIEKASPQVPRKQKSPTIYTVRLSMTLQVYFRLFIATDTVLDAKDNGRQSAIHINL